MSNYCTCKDDQYIYRFSQNENRLQFYAAKQHCIDSGGWLAKDLSRTIYTHLNTCCKNQHFYWIGLVSDNSCLNSAKGRYHWIGRRECHNEPTLMLPTPSSNNCQAVTLGIKTPNNQIPRPQVQDCTTRQHYICQIRRQKTTTRRVEPTTTATTTMTAKTPSRDHKTTASQVTTPKNSTDVVGSDSNNINLEFLYGILGGCALFLLLLIILYCRFYKKYNLSQLKKLGKKNTKHSVRSGTSNTSEMHVQNQVYFNVESTAVIYQAIDPQANHPEGQYEVIKSNSVENATYVYAADVEANAYQKLDDPSIQKKAEPDHHYENDHVDEYNKLYLHPLGFSKKDKRRSTKQAIDDQSSNAASPDLPQETVEYTTVRSINEPIAVYSSVEKTGKNNLK